MYSQLVIDKTLDAFEEKNGWRPVEHSLDQVIEFTEYVNSILDVDANSVNRYFDIKPGVRLTQARRDWIAQFVKNEQFMCFANAMYFMTRYGYFCDAEENIYRYSPRDSQKILHQIISEFDELQVAIELFVLKARQLGCSTMVALYFLHRILFRPNTKAVMASVKQKQSDLIGRIQEICWSRLPFWLPPAKTKLKTDSPEWANGSILSIQSGSQDFGIAQGWTPTCIHISEVGDVPNPKKILETGLFRAAHSTKALFFVMEGTGNGDTGWQAEKWRYYKANWGKGGRFRPIFIPPVCAKDLYPLPDWLKKNPIPHDWHPCEETLRMQRKGELYVRSTDYLARAMGSNFKMSREYLWFWDTNWREAVASHTEKEWLGQMPCTDDEALQSKHDRVMNDEQIEVITKEREKSYVPYAITGKTILVGSDNKPYEPPTEYINFNLPRIPISFQGPDENRYNFELVPLKHFNDDDDTECFNKLLIFHPPKEGVDYSIGVDCADGLGMPNEDRSSLSVIINRTGRERDEQVAAFTSININSPQMSRIAAAVATLYGADTRNAMGCKFAIEQRRKPGDECQHQLKIMGFYYHHRMVMYDSKGMPDPSKATKEGFYTNVWSRPMMLNKFIDAVNTGWFKPNCPILIRQLKELIRKETGGQSRIDHDTGKHNDNVFSSGMAYFTAHDMDNTALRQEQRYQSVKTEESQISMGWYDNSVVLA